MTASLCEVQRRQVSTSAIAAGQRRRHVRWPELGLLLVIIAGAALRLIWPGDIEYKQDEIFMFDRTQNAGRTEPWPGLGMMSGASVARLRNPGMSVWVYLIPARLFHLRTPPDLARLTEWSSIAALLLWTWFAFYCVEEEHREAWLWAVALLAVNPLEIELQRKIWAQSMLPLFDFALLLGWWRRDRRWGAALWGIASAWVGQVHMSGFFFAAALFLWTALFGRRLAAGGSPTAGRSRWPAYWIGCVIGVITLYPWLRYLFSLHRSAGRGAAPYGFPSHFWQLWVLDALGLDMQASLTDAYREFLSYPILGTHPTNLVLAILVAIGIVAVVILTRAGVALWRKRSAWLSLLIGEQSRAAFLVSASMWGFGILMTAAWITIHSHYLLVALPFPFLWLARAALPANGDRALPRARQLLATLCALQLVLSVAFLCFIHANDGAPGSDYGVAYHAQAVARQGDLP